MSLSKQRSRLKISNLKIRIPPNMNTDRPKENEKELARLTTGNNTLQMAVRMIHALNVELRRYVESLEKARAELRRLNKLIASLIFPDDIIRSIPPGNTILGEFLEDDPVGGSLEIAKEAQLEQSSGGPADINIPSAVFLISSPVIQGILLYQSGKLLKNGDVLGANSTLEIRVRLKLSQLSTMAKGKLTNSFYSIRAIIKDVQSHVVITGDEVTDKFAVGNKFSDSRIILEGLKPGNYLIKLYVFSPLARISERRDLHITVK